MRQEVVSAIVKAAKSDISKITDDMLTVIKERTLDKKVVFQIITGFLIFSMSNVKVFWCAKDKRVPSVITSVGPF